jgi:hypothetical protein
MIPRVRVSVVYSYSGGSRVARLWWHTQEARTVVPERNPSSAEAPPQGRESAMITVRLVRMRQSIQLRPRWWRRLLPPPKRWEQRRERRLVFGIPIGPYELQVLK